MKTYFTLFIGVAAWAGFACFAFGEQFPSDVVLGFCLPYVFGMASMILAILLLESRFWRVRGR